MIRYAVLSLLFATGCSTAPKCAVLGDSSTVFSDEKSCSVRIRQVAVASKMNLPQSVKTNELTTWTLGWSQSDFKNGQIEVGHFTLNPPNVGKEVAQ